MKNLNIFLVLVFISGCSTAGALNRLQDLSLTRDEQQACVKKQEAQFQQLLKDFSGNAIEMGAPKVKIMEAYGEPISIKSINAGSLLKEELMYRHPVQFFGSEKIFLYFDSDDKLIDARYDKPSADK